MPEAKVETKIEASKEKPAEIDIEPGEVFATLELIVRDKDGNVVEYRKQKSKSFVKQFFQLLYSQGYGLGLTPADLVDTVKDITNTDRRPIAVSTMFKCNAGVGSATNGVVVGTGSTAATIDDYALETQIAHGTGAGELQYGAMTFGEPSAGASISQFRLTRDFANGSGGSIDVSEVGLYVSGGSHNFMTIRDVLGTPIAVPNGQTLTVNYQMQGSI